MAVTGRCKLTILASDQNLTKNEKTLFKWDGQEGSLKISAFDQLEFLKSLFRNSLPASTSAQRLAKRLMPSEVLTLDSLLSGKMGSGCIDVAETLRLGWYIVQARFLPKKALKPYILFSSLCFGLSFVLTLILAYFPSAQI